MMRARRVVAAVAGGLCCKHTSALLLLLLCATVATLINVQLPGVLDMFAGNNSEPAWAPIHSHDTTYTSMLASRVFAALVLSGSTSSMHSVDNTASLGGTGSNGCCCLPPAVVKALLVQLLLLAPRLASTDLKGLLLQMLISLISTGEDAHIQCRQRQGSSSCSVFTGDTTSKQPTHSSCMHSR